MKLIVKLLTGLMWAFYVAISQAQYNQIIVLGDSLSDQGNLLSTGQVPFLAAAPYVDGSFSNGPVAVEVLAESLGVELMPSLHLTGEFTGTNFAVAGARAGGDSPIDLTTQLNAVLGVNGGILPSDALYIVFFGGNDIRDTRESSFRDSVANLYRATNNINTAVQTMISAGAKNIVIANSPDIGGIPETALIAQGNPRQARKLTRHTLIFNYFIKRTVNRLRRANTDTEVRIMPFDLFSFVRKLQSHGDDLGYANTEDACFVQIDSLNQVYNPACDFERFFFFDAIHPTAVTHARAASALQAILPKP